MPSSIPSLRWSPVETGSWSRRAYGRDVHFESQGGTLVAKFESHQTPAQLYLQATVVGRMLVEVYCNGVQVMDELVSNEELDCFVDLTTSSTIASCEVELHFIPATFGEVKISRAVHAVADDGSIKSRLRGLKNRIELSDDLTLL